VIADTGGAPVKKEDVDNSYQTDAYKSWHAVRLVVIKALDVLL
jgi:hypothetical protein